MTNKTILNTVCALLLAMTAHFSFAQEMIKFDDLQTKQRYYSLLEELRCLVCQNQSLADSDAGLAQDLRDEVDQMLRAGKSDDEIVNFMVERYGDFVLYDPPFKATTILLWFSPFLFVVFGITGLVFHFRKNSQATPVLDSGRRSRAADLLGNNTDQ